MISPLLEKLAERNKDVSFVKVNVDVAQDLAAQYEISALPTVKTFAKETYKKSFMGVKDSKFIENFIKESFE
jgi:thioredoxin-like negative regulator of GroEL